MESKPDRTILDAAQGWLDLGDFNSAMEELDKLPPDQRIHAAVLTLRWRIFEKAGKWESAYILADSIRIGASDQSFWWYATALSMHMLGRSKEALELLQQGPTKHGKNAGDVLYLIARLNCRLGDVAGARLALTGAFDVADDPAELKLKALEDEDLKELWAKSS